MIMEKMLMDNDKLYDYFKSEIKCRQRFILCLNMKQCNNGDCKKLGYYFEELETCDECGHKLEPVKLLCQWNEKSSVFDDGSVRCYSLNKKMYVRIYFGVIAYISLINDDVSQVEKRMYIVNL